MSLEEDRFKQIMEAIAATKSGMEQQFATNLHELRQEVAATQANCSQQVLEKLNRKSCTFKKKGCEHQFVFNDKVDDRLQNAQKQLDKITTADNASKQALEWAKVELDQGKDEIRVRQKHIRIADRSDWAVVAEYEADELADNSDDEKRQFRAQKERDSKRKRAASGGPAKKKKQRTKGSTRLDDGGVRRAPFGPRTTRAIGPCYSCSQWGLLTRSCPRNHQLYPFDEPVVSAGDTVWSNSSMVSSTEGSVGGNSVTEVDNHSPQLAAGVKGHVQKPCADSTAKQMSNSQVTGVDNSGLGTGGPLGKARVSGQTALGHRSTSEEPLDCLESDTPSESNEWELTRSWEWRNLGP